jgi:hypothetical protein
MKIVPRTAAIPTKYKPNFSIDVSPVTISLRPPEPEGPIDRHPGVHHGEFFELVHVRSVKE